MFLKDTPIRRKLMTILLLTSGAVLISTCAAFFACEFVTFRQTTVRQLSTLGEVIANNSTAALAFQNKDDGKEILAALKAERHIVAASLYDKNGRLFSKYPPDLPVEAFPIAPDKDGYRFEHGHLVAFQPVVQGANKRLGTLYLKSDMLAMYERFRLYGSLAVLVIAVSFLLAYLLAGALQQQISQPLLALADTAKAISEQRDYSVRATQFGKDEVGDLTGAFNQMLAQIQAQDAVLKEKEVLLTKALQESQSAEEEVRRLNEGLEMRVRERTAQLEEANKELESFSYSASHDLRAPLRHIEGYVELVVRQAGTTLNDKSRGYLDTVSETVSEMGQLIDDLLDFSRVGRVELRQTTVNLEELVEGIIAGLKQDTQGRNIVWKRGVLPPVQGDPALLKQVFVNLVSNAVKYTRPRDPAQIEMGCVSGKNGEAVLFVRDNGVGFDMKYVGKLFGVFQRLHHTDEFEGTGIGLANVRRIVVRHGGRIWAEATLNGGATFYFTLTKARKG